MSSRINPELLRLAKLAVVKSAFVAQGDPAMDPEAAAAAAGGGAPGGVPPGDPAAGGMPPGGAPPGGGDPLAALMPTIQQLVQQAVAQSQGGMAGGAAGGAGMAGGGLKPKIDVNIEIMQIKKMLAKIMDAMQITMPVSEMVATPDDLNQMAAEQQGAPPAPQGGAIPPVGPMEPMKAAVWEQGQAFTPPASMHYAHATATEQLAAKAQAMLLQHLARQGA